MKRVLLYSLCLILLSSAMVMAEEKEASTTSSGQSEPAPTEAKALKGMSVLGNNEAPMSLFIVSWKSSQLGTEANVKRTLSERDAPVDREVFMREVNFYQVSVGEKQ